jgi:integrase
MGQERKRRLRTARQVIDTYHALGDETAAGAGQTERRRVLERFLEFLGDLPLSRCDAQDLIAFLASNPEWASDWTKLRIIATVKRPFHWAWRAGLIDQNPFRSVSHRSGRRGRCMLPSERQAILRASKPEFRRVLIFAAFTGARPGEIRSLQWEHVDRARSCAVLLQHKTARSRRDRAPRVIVLHPVVIALLSWIRARQPMSRYVFLNGLGKPWTKSALDLRFWRARRRLGLPEDCKLYSARHEWATRAAKAGVDLATLAELLGHTSTAMSEYYLHLAGQTDHLQEAVKKAMKANIEY